MVPDAPLDPGVAGKMYIIRCQSKGTALPVSAAHLVFQADLDAARIADSQLWSAQCFER